MKRNIALLYGGGKSEHEVSKKGFAYVMNLLEKSDCRVIPVYITKSGSWRLSEDGLDLAVFPSPECGGSLRCDGGDIIPIDAAIPLLHGEGGESGEVQGLFMAARIPFVGADVITSAVCLDKHYTKCVAKNLGIPVAKWVSFSEKTDTDTALSICVAKLGFPMFIKPRRLGSSVGAYPILCESDFRSFFPSAMSAGNNMVIVEELIPDKRELECAYYSALGVRKISAPGEIFSEGFYSYDEKYNKPAKTVAEAITDAATCEKLKAYNLLLANECSLRHLARIDYFLTDDGLIFNEINTFPGFTESSLYPKLLEKMGISARDALLSFIEDAINARSV